MKSMLVRALIKEVRLVITLDTAMAVCIFLVWIMLIISVALCIYVLRVFSRCIDVLHYVLLCYEKQEVTHHEGTD